MTAISEELSDEKLTQNEFRELFGDQIPIEAINLVWNAPPETTISEIRSKLRQMALSLRSGNGGEVRVKALEWLSGYGVEAEYAEPVTDIRYSVHRDDHNGGWVLFTGNAAREGNKHRAASRDEAKAAAQADFETRIRSALDIKP